VRVVAAGEGLGLDAEAAAREAMGADEYEILVELEEGPGTATVTTCDLSADYVRINAEYRT
jgi:glutamate N-acetyltransferase/amino-acid N-acetyltransferase